MVINTEYAPHVTEWHEADGIAVHYFLCGIECRDTFMSQFNTTCFDGTEWTDTANSIWVDTAEILEPTLCDNCREYI